MAVTLAQARSRVRSLIDEPSAEFWTDAEILTWLNEGQNDIARRAECLRASSDIAVTASTQTYTGPTDAVRLTRVEWLPDSSDRIYPLIYRDRMSADSVWGTTQAQTEGTPMIWTTDGFPPTLDITLYPTPTEDGDIRVFYYKLPTALSDDGDTLGLPAGWEDLAVEYAVARAFRKDGNPQWQEAHATYVSHLDALVEISIRFTDQAGQIDDAYGQSPMSWLYAGTGDWW